MIGANDNRNSRAQRIDGVRSMRATVAHVPQSAPVQSGRRTSSDKQADVLSMMDAHPELSDREFPAALVSASKPSTYGATGGATHDLPF